MNLYQFLKDKLNPNSVTIPATNVDKVTYDGNNADDRDLFRKFGVITSDLRHLIQDQTLISYERSQLYRAFDDCLNHPLMSAAAGMYADTATVFNARQGATVWVTAENKEYQKQIEKMLDIINLEEVIFDWAWSIATFGDLFVQCHGEPGIGLVSVSDDQHPINVSRVDYAGRLIGFYETPAGYNVADERQLLPPWEYTHFRLLGAKKRRPVYGMGENNTQYSEYRSISIMTPDPRRLTSKYGTSVLVDALPIWKRLRLSEDSILMARITRGVMRYLYKVGIPEGNANAESISSLIDNYVQVLKRARSLDVSGSQNKNYQDRFAGMANLEDIIVPVWGDVNSLQVEKLGGEVDIKWLKDIDEQRNQLATALKVPLSMLAGYGKEAPPSLGNGNLDRLDIRFARQARRVQRSLINGLTRMAQIHLAYQGMDPDVNMFEIHLSETSSAEEEEMAKTLETSVSVVNGLTDIITTAIGEENTDRKELLGYLNDKFLKLTDLDVDKLILTDNPNAFDAERTEEPVPGVETAPGGEAFTEVDDTEGEDGLAQENPFRESKTSSDFKASLPKDNVKKKKMITKGKGKKAKLVESGEEIEVRTDENWDKNWAGLKVQIKPVKQKK